MTSGPEAIARRCIDAQLAAAGWVLQDARDFNRNAAEGVAVRKLQLPSGPCDYLLFVDCKAAGVIEAKNTGVILSGVAGQSEKYMARLPELETRGLRDCQIGAIEGLEKSLAEDRPRALIQLATGAGKELHDTNRARVIATWLGKRHSIWRTKWSQ